MYILFIRNLQQKKSDDLRSGDYSGQEQSYQKIEKSIRQNPTVEMSMRTANIAFSACDQAPSCLQQLPRDGH